MAVRQPERQPTDDGIDFWARVFEQDFRQHRRRRSLAQLAREIGVPLRTLAYHVQLAQLPPFDIAYRVATAVGIEGEDVLLFYRRDNASNDTATLEELSRVDAAA